MLRLFSCSLEFRSRNEIRFVGENVRGIYMLYTTRDEKIFELVYVGMSDSNVAYRLRRHDNSKRKKWTHFSVYAVWPNIMKVEIQELEGLLRHIYRRDKRANIFNLQRGCRAFRKIKVTDFKEWRTKTRRYQ